MSSKQETELLRKSFHSNYSQSTKEKHKGEGKRGSHPKDHQRAEKVCDLRADLAQWGALGQSPKQPASQPKTED